VIVQIDFDNILAQVRLCLAYLPNLTPSSPKVKQDWQANEIRNISWGSSFSSRQW
jgi:hypothetical protein